MFVEQTDSLELHYYFKDDTHTIDAVFRNECEKEILSLFKDIAETLGIHIDLETHATQEGGFKEFWSLLGRHNGQITLIVSLAAILISRMPVENKELTKLQIENLRLDNQIKRNQLNELKLDSVEKQSAVDQKTVIDSLNLVNMNYKVSWRKSNIFKKLSFYEKVDSIEVQRYLGKRPVGKARKVPRLQFDRFILRSDDLPSLNVSKGVIDVINPTIKSGRFKWKGFYNDEIINFEMHDEDFKLKVLRGEVHFSNTFSIEVEMTLFRTIDRDGNIKIVNSIVRKVYATIENGSKTNLDGI